MKSKIARRLDIEQLEGRSLMAGNVLASVDASGLLTVQGDDAANQIHIRQLPATSSTGTWAGVRYAIETPETWNTTTINGQPDAVVEGVKSVNISMNDGRDTVYVVSPNRPNQLTNLPGVVNIDMGNNANDAFREYLVLRVENHTEINVNLGTGRDALEMYGIVNRLNVIGDPLWRAEDAPLPSADDIVNINSLQAGGPVLIDTRYGNDQVAVSFGTTTLNSTVTVNTGGGNDTVYLSGQFKSALRVDSGDGNDYVQVNPQQAGTVAVNLGRGNDELQLGSRDSVFARLGVWLGQGDDHLDLVGVKSLKSNLGGGDGTDTLETHESLPNDLGDATISGFEILEE